MAEASFTTASCDQTERIAAALAAHLDPGDIALIEGELGTGKTAFVRGACASLGVSDRVSSPTFTIGRLYRGSAVDIAHLDLFRLDSLSGEDGSLLEDYAAPDRLTFIEWPGAAAGDLPEERIRLRVKIHHAGADGRRIEIRGDARLVAAACHPGCANGAGADGTGA